MNKLFRKLFLTALTCPLLTTNIATADISTSQKNELDQLFNNYLSSSTGSSATLEIREELSDGDIVTLYRKSYGKLSNSYYSPVTPLNTLMRQASLSKTIVVAAAQALITENKVSKNTIVFCNQGQTPQANDCIIPWGGSFSDPQYHNIKFGNLMAHTSGLAGNDPSPSSVFDLIYSPSIDDVIEAMRSKPLQRSPRATIDFVDSSSPDFEYANRGYDILAHAIGLASGEKNFITYVRKLASTIGVCEGDIRLASPLFTGAVHNREPQYYSWDGWQNQNLFERPITPIPLGDFLVSPDGGDVYGLIPGGGGLTTTTHALLKFSEHYDIFKGTTRNGSYIRGGGGPGTLTQQGQRVGSSSGNKIDYAYALNTNGSGSAENAFTSAVLAKINAISQTSNAQIPTVKAQALAYNTACPSFSNAEEPNHEVAQSQWEYFDVSGATKVTLFNMSADVDLYVRQGGSNPTITQYDCRPYNPLQEKETCALNVNQTYKIGVRGYLAGKFMLDIEYPQPVIPSNSKLAEFGDPVLGNDFNGCGFAITYSTGGGGFVYKEYTATCDSGTYKMGVITNFTQNGQSCTFAAASSGIYGNGNCQNWRIYKQ